jgi:hypothetical protein
MALVDPSIAMGYRGGEIPNQLAQYGQVQQILAAQDAQQMNALKMQEARATMEERNALRQLNPSSPDYEQQLFKLNPQLGIAYRKEASTAAAQEAARKKSEFDLTAARSKFGDDLKRNLSANPSNENVIAWGQDAVLQGIYSKDQVASTVEQLLALPPEQRVNVLSRAGATAGELKPHVITENLGGTSRISAIPAFGGAPTVVSTTKKTMTPGEAEANLIARAKLAQDATGVVYQEDANGNVIALPSKLKAGEVPTARIAVAPGGGFQALQGKPSEAVGKEQMSINQQRAIVKGAIEAVDKTPDAFGMTRGLVGETLGGRMGSSEENQARSYLFNVVSGVIKERAGTAQSASEAETLARFLPQPTDAADVIKDKMQAFDKYLSDKESGTTKKRSSVVKAQLTPVDQQALQWANSNPGDLRSAAIKQRLGQ